MSAEQPEEYGMERSHPQARGNFRIYQSADPLFHLTCCFVGKCQRHYAIRFRAIVEEIHDLICQHTCLAGASPGNHKGGSVLILHSVALLRIQQVKVIITYFRQSR